jgi:hypothetical protein
LVKVATPLESPLIKKDCPEAILPLGTEEFTPTLGAEIVPVPPR